MLAIANVRNGSKADIPRPRPAFFGRFRPHLLDRLHFSGIDADGALDRSAFFAGAAAGTADHRIIYHAATGRIFYDGDGSGAEAAILFARVDAGTVLTAADFNAYGPDI
ncbi:MAG TPA: hypothetical protein VF582_03030 [Allosphingosinicella sp.]|jgi:hypothetical protein